MMMMIPACDEVEHRRGLKENSKTMEKDGVRRRRRRRRRWRRWRRWFDQVADGVAFMFTASQGPRAAQRGVLLEENET